MRWRIWNVVRITEWPCIGPEEIGEVLFVKKSPGKISEWEGDLRKMNTHVLLVCP